MHLTIKLDPEAVTALAADIETVTGGWCDGGTTAVEMLKLVLLAEARRIMRNYADLAADLRTVRSRT